MRGCCGALNYLRLFHVFLISLSLLVLLFLPAITKLSKYMMILRCKHEGAQVPQAATPALRNLP